MHIQRVQVPPVSVLDSYLPRSGGADDVTREAVGRILADVASRGDAAVQAYTAKFDGIDLPPGEWEVPPAHWQVALQRLDGAVRHALEVAAERVRAYHLHQLDAGFMVRDADGTELGSRVTPLDRVGLYVPGGKASYPSSVIMNAVPAAVAGVREIIVVTPPGPHLTDAVLAACALAGVSRIFRVGGVQAIGALAYGTETIPGVDKVVGPGNRWVAEAKRQVVGVVGIDAIAGPTEVLVLADETASAAGVAADLLAQAEHDEDAVAWCVTTSTALADALPAALDAALARAPRAAIARASLARNGLVVVVPSMETALTVCDLRAPEHLQVLTRDAHAVAARVRHAGAIFIGEWTPEPVGDYIAGPSHVLPTGGTARFASPLGVPDFVKRTSIVAYSAARLRADAALIVALAESEGLPGHADAVRIRTS